MVKSGILVQLYGAAKALEEEVLKFVLNNCIIIIYIKLCDIIAGIRGPQRAYFRGSALSYLKGEGALWQLTRAWETFLPSWKDRTIHTIEN